MEAENSKRTDRTREIVAAALDVFTNKGFQAAGMEQIAAAAGIGKSTLYEYFTNKEELFISAVQEASRRWAGELAAIGQDTDDAVERLQKTAALCMEFLEPEREGENRLFFDVIMQSVMQGGVFFNRRHLIREIHQRIIRIVVDHLLTGVSRGQLRADIARHAEKIAINFMACLDGIQLHSMVAGDYMDGRKQMEFFVKNFIPLLVPETNASESAGAVPTDGSAEQSG